jgi:mannose-6-phosphate isomerase-like protein (cupin superfamily)
MANTFRRVVTARNVEGKSIIASDTRIAVGSLGIIDFWKSTSVPSSLVEDSDKLPGPICLEPPKGGICFRFFEIPRQDIKLSRDEANRRAATEFSSVGAAHCRVDTSRNPMMHTTPTVDYVVVLSGKVTLLLDKDEVELNPFDVVIQRGTNHYWLNYDDKPALLMGVLLDAR